MSRHMVRCFIRHAAVFHTPIFAIFFFTSLPLMPLISLPRYIAIAGRRYHHAIELRAMLAHVIRAHGVTPMLIAFRRRCHFAAIRHAATFTPF